MKSLGELLARAPNRPRPFHPVPVCLLITELDVGGAERALVSLATGLDRDRWSPVVVSLGPGGPLAEPLLQSGIPTACLDLKPSRLLAAPGRLRAAMAPHRPNLLQSFLFHANIAARLVAPFIGRPVVVGGLRVADREHLWHLRIDRFTESLSNGAVCVSRGVLEFSQHAAGLAPDRLVVIPNGIDPKPYSLAEPIRRSQLGLPDGCFLVLYVGRLHPQKGLDTLLEAALRVASQVPDWHLVIAGDGPLNASLQARASSHSLLKQRVHFLGHRGDVPSLLAASDLLVLPSRWEGMPNVILEAMAAGKPVISTAVEGSEDLVISGQTGWLIRPGCPDGLVGAFLEASLRRSRLKEMGDAGRKRVEACFSRDSVTAAYDWLWSRLLGFQEAVSPPPSPLSLTACRIS